MLFNVVCYMCKGRYRLVEHEITRALVWAVIIKAWYNVDIYVYLS
jgi:hypothetical protein